MVELKCIIKEGSKRNLRTLLEKWSHKLSFKRFISVYNKFGERPIDQMEIEINKFDIKLVQKIFSIEDDNPMYDVYKIEKEHASYFKDTYSLKFDFEKFDYFLECHEEN
tara:strand:+ start:343 stop:669 length:327 start_codon:yes stop_codon:yes gene_type:complete